jgi:hypothetical protein
MFENLAQAECGVFLIECFAGDQKVLLRSVATSLWKSDSLALSGDVCLVSQPPLDLLCGSRSSLERVVFVSKLMAASCVRWAEELFKSNQSVIRCHGLESLLAHVQ